LVIYLRDYLIPGTPRITEQYVPHQVLNVIKSPPDQQSAEPRADDTDAFLRDSGVLDVTADGTLQLSPSFRQRWRDRMRDLRSGRIDAADVTPVVDASPAAVRQRAPLQFQVGENRLVQWDSPGEVVADVGAGTELAATSGK